MLSKHRIIEYIEKFVKLTDEESLFFISCFKSHCPEKGQQITSIWQYGG